MSEKEKGKAYDFPYAFADDVVAESQIPLIFHKTDYRKGVRKVLSLFSGCGGMDLGFEGNFIANKKSFGEKSKYVCRSLNEDWVLLKKTHFQTIFANDILPD